MSRSYSADDLALMRELTGRGLPLAEALPHFPGRNRSSLWYAAKRRGMRWAPAPPNRPNAHSPEVLTPIRRAWNETELSAREIGEFFGMTKNQVIGLANRGNWRERARGGDRSKAKTTLPERMAALHAMMERVLAENPPGTGRLTERAEAAE